MPDSPDVNRRSLFGWGVLSVLLAVEAFFFVWVLLVMVLSVLGGGGLHTQSVSLLLMVVLSLAWVLWTLVSVVRSKASAARGSALTIHVLLFAAGTGCLQLEIGPFWLGAALIIVALLGFAAAVLARPAERERAAEGDDECRGSDSE